MKKILLMSAVLVCSSLQADAEVKPVAFYAGAGLVANSTGSDFSMDYAVDDNNWPVTLPHANHKEKHMGRIGGELFLGVKSKCKDGWFWAAELSYGFAKSNHRHDFPEQEDTEVDDAYTGPERISYIDIKHGNEIGLVGKFGRSVNFWNVYGILGLTTKEVEIKYGIDSNHVDTRQPLEINPDKRVYGAVFGIGASKQVHDKISCAIEYKYKLYQDAKKDVNLIDASKPVFSITNATHDISDRHFKVKSHRHEVSLRVAVNV